MNRLIKRHLIYNNELIQINARLKDLKHKVHLLHPNHVDSDFLEELVKERLGLIGSDEYVLIIPNSCIK